MPVSSPVVGFPEEIKDAVEATLIAIGHVVHVVVVVEGALISSWVLGECCNPFGYLCSRKWWGG